MNPAFAFVSGGFPPDIARVIAAGLERVDVQGETLGQTGFDLVHFPQLHQLLAPIVAVAKTVFPDAQLRLDRSSCRRQPPDGKGKLELHQDVAAMTLDTGAVSQGVIVWLPLCEIDEYTPTLDVCPVLPDCAFEHHRDQHNYSILSDVPDGIPLMTLTRMSLGDYLVMKPFTIHRSNVRPWHTKPRISLDLRFFSEAP